MNASINLQGDATFRVMIRNPNGVGPHRALTQAQFSVIHDDLVASMNKGRALTDSFVITKLAQVGQPIDFTPTPADILMDTALYQAAPFGRAFLSDWVKDELRYSMVRAYLSNEELDLFDMRCNEDEQRTFLVLVSVCEGAEAPVQRRFGPLHRVK